MKRIALRILECGLVLLPMALPAREATIVNDDIATYYNSVDEDEVYVGNFTFSTMGGMYVASKHITADVYKIFPQNRKPYYVAFYKEKKYLLMEVGERNGRMKYYISVEGEEYFVSF